MTFNLGLPLSAIKITH